MFFKLLIWKVVKVFVVPRLKIESALIKKSQEGINPVEKNAAENLKNLLLVIFDVNFVVISNCYKKSLSIPWIGLELYKQAYIISWIRSSLTFDQIWYSDLPLFYFILFCHKKLQVRYLQFNNCRGISMLNLFSNLSITRKSIK